MEIVYHLPNMCKSTGPQIHAFKLKNESGRSINLKLDVVILSVDKPVQ